MLLMTIHTLFKRKEFIYVNISFMSACCESVITNNTICTHFTVNFKLEQWQILKTQIHTSPFLTFSGLKDKKLRSKDSAQGILAGLSTLAKWSEDLV